MSQYNSAFRRSKRRNEQRNNKDYDKLCKIIQQSSLTLKQIKNGQSFFSKNLIEDDYTIPFLKDKSLKLDTVLKMREPKALNNT